MTEGVGLEDTEGGDVGRAVPEKSAETVRVNVAKAVPLLGLEVSDAVAVGEGEGVEREKLKPVPFKTRAMRSEDGVPWSLPRE